MRKALPHDCWDTEGVCCITVDLDARRRRNVQMIRPKSVIAAAVLQFLLSISGIILALQYLVHSTET